MFTNIQNKKCLNGYCKQIAGLQMREVKNLDDGTLEMTELLGKIRPEFPDPHEPYTALVCIENTHNYCGGTILPIEWIDQVPNIYITIMINLVIIFNDV